MKTSASSILLALAALATAQDLPPDLPSCVQVCAQPYFVTSSGYTTFAGCDVRNVACVCANKQFISEISCCISKSCSAGDQKAAADFGGNLCSQVSLPGTPPLPSIASCAAGNGTSATSTSVPATTVTGSMTTLASPTVTGATAASRNPTIRGRAAR
ncbi:hypothetical protein GLAREA_05293 [Glarea lozoyensis ATCC 20868]|uniref:CFEM domain-containing protein n=1 Tax=Glarea lozoyensis (strain ATCC 20868 / MF5171) TaxID=1116229 RepID=S3DDX1_GLAL2|nr:uncharacterized protein GLAREA_05293 [Glarea lozoyensis ATCC 20868]EPE35955.1 hypothetical protein GLAREA_05293 [Glarea lozoyensis ATCC 20868]